MDVVPHVSGPAALFWGIVTFSLLVVIHEGGHFLAARMFRVRVHEFMIGLPGPALRLTSRRSGTSYGLTVVPLGGYVRIAGMEPGPEDDLLADALWVLSASLDPMPDARFAAALGVDEARAASLLATLRDYAAAEQDVAAGTHAARLRPEAGEDAAALLARARADTYRGLATWKRIVVLAAGVVFNLLAALLTVTVVLAAWGYEVPSNAPVVGEVVAGSPAQRAGMRAGDRVLTVDGTPVTRFDGIRPIVRRHRPGDTLLVSVRRGPRTLTLSVVLVAPAKGPMLLGLRSGWRTVRFGVFAAFLHALELIGAVFVAIAHFFDPSRFREAVSGARSVVGISYEVAQAAENGPLDYAWLTAVLSLSLGAMNVLPLPPLDGGKIALELVEAVRRRPLSVKTTLAVSAVGAAVLLSLIFYLMYADVVRYIVRA